MLRIAIVDDEEPIRLGLAKIIERTDASYRVVGVWSGGPEALGRLEEVEADLILTDIRMPRMDGLEMIAELRRRGNTARVAILSGYDDFVYAREALRLDVEDYLLKPVNQDELNRLLASVAGKVEEERSRQPFRPESLMELLLEADAGRVSRQVWQGACSQLDELPLFRHYYAVIALHSVPDCEEERVAAAVGEWKRECRILMREGGLIAVILAIRPGDHADTARELAVTLLGRLPIDLRVRAGTGGAYSGGERLPQAYREAEIAVQEAWYGTDGHPVAAYAPGLSQRAQDDAQLRKSVADELRPALPAAEAGGAEAAVHGWIDKAAALRLRWNALGAAASRLLAAGEDDRSRAGKTVQEPPAAEPLAMPERYGDWAGYAADLLQAMKERIASAGERRHASGAVERIKDYLQEQYKEELDLHKLAEHVHLTPSYLSKLFRSETGETLTDFAISVRIRHAKRLLREDHALKTYEVGERVGYADPAYFAKIFKRITGQTPKEYRDSVR